MKKFNHREAIPQLCTVHCELCTDRAAINMNLLILQVADEGQQKLTVGARLLGKALEHLAVFRIMHPGFIGR